MNKLTPFEFIYYTLSIYCIYASQELHLVTVKTQGTADVFVLHPSLIFLGAIAPITTMTSSLSVSGIIVGVFILLSPLMGAILYKDYKQKRFGVSCFILTMLVTSLVVTGTIYSPVAGVGGLTSLFVISALFIFAVMSSVKEELQKQLSTTKEKRR